MAPGREGLGRAGRQQKAQLKRLYCRPILAEPGDEHLIDRLFWRARAIDPPAWAERDRLTVERGISPARMEQKPRNEAERPMQNRRMYSIRLAMDEDLCGGDPAIAAAPRSVSEETSH